MTMSVSQSTSSFLPTGLRALIVAAGFWVLSMPLTITAGSVSAVLGCIAASFFIDLNIRREPLRSLRQGIIVLGAVLLTVLASLLSQFLIRSDLSVALFGPILSYQLAQSLLWLLGAITLTTIMRTMAQRYSWGKVLEVLFVAAAFVIALAAHRQGMIHRPYFIGDFALIRGIDPSSILLIIGCAAVLSLSALLMAEGNHRRLPYHFSALGLLCFSLLLYVQFIGMPSPRLTNDLGLTGQSPNAEGRQQEPDNPFRDGENDPADREAPVAIVVFRDDYDPAAGIYYFRESAYSEFDGNMLATATNPALDRDLIREFPRSEVVVEEDIPARDQRQTVRTTIGLLTPHRSPFGLDAPLSFTNVPNPNSLRFRQTYDVVSLVPEFEFPDLLARDAGSADWTLAQWQEYLAMPDDPRYGELAQELVSGLRPEFANDPYAKAQMVKNWLDENGIYSLANEHAYATDPAASFLFGDLTGYCVHFAYAATYMYRALGIPARVAVGYAVPAQNRAGGSALLIQAVNGHAWPEIYLQDLGWVIVDPSPLQSLVDMSVDPQDALQQLLGDMLRDDAALEEFMLSQQGSGLNIAALLRVLYSSLLALLLAAWLIRIWRQLAVRTAAPADLHRLCYRAALDTLAAHGYSRHHGESREAFARRIGQQLPAFASMSQAHLELALGRPQKLSAESAVMTVAPAQTTLYWRAMNRALHQQLRAQHSRWLRLLAWLDPAPWLRSR